MRDTRKVLLILSIAVITFCIGMPGMVSADEKPAAAPAAASEKPQPPPPPPPKYDALGAPLPPMTMKYLGEEKTIALDKLGKPSMFMFVNSACSACRLEMSVFTGMAKNLKDRMDVYVVSVDFDPVQAFSRMTTPEMKESYVILDGSDFVVAKALGFNYTPATVIVDKTGMQTFRKGGFSEGDDSVISKEVMKVLKK